MILDTNAVSALVDDDPAAWAVLTGRGEPRLPVIVFAEFESGLRGSNQGAKLRPKFDLLIQQCDRLLVDWATGSVYADIRHDLKRRGRPIPQNDLWIAALAVQHALPILSRDTHFDAVEVVTRVGW